MDHQYLIGRLENAGNLFYAATNIHTYVIDVENRKIVEIPRHTLKNCLCKKIAAALHINVDLSHMYKNCNLPTNVNRQLIYKCPFGLTNIIVPVTENNRIKAALLGGPMLTEDPEKFLQREIAPRFPIEGQLFHYLKQELEAYPCFNTNQIITHSEILSALTTYDGGHFSILQEGGRIKLEEPNSNYNEEVCSRLLYSVIDFISANYANDITLSDVAKATYVNPSYLSRVFNKELNCHFRSYLNNMRIDTSKDLLADPKLSIADICSQVGFGDQSHFNRVFKQKEGITPGQYRRKLMKQAVMQTMEKRATPPPRKDMTKNI